MATQQQEQAGGSAHHPTGKLKVEVSTTAGSYPTEGFEEVPENQKVQVQLEKAARNLHITNTDGWIATVTDESGKKKNIVITDSYTENHLTGTVTIDWGPSEGGGGARASGRV